VGCVIKATPEVLLVTGAFIVSFSAREVLLFSDFFFLPDPVFIMPTGMFGTIRTKERKIATNTDAVIITGIEVGKNPPVSPKILKIGGLEISKIEI